MYLSRRHTVERHVGRWAAGARALVPEKTGQREAWGALGIRQATSTGEQTLESKTRAQIGAWVQLVP